MSEELPDGGGKAHPEITGPEQSHQYGGLGWFRSFHKREFITKVPDAAGRDNLTLFRMGADSDQERLVISGVWVEVVRRLPRLAPKKGKWPVYDAKGNIKGEGDFSKGQLTGRWTYWHPNGQKKSEGEYVRDLREGNWVEWNERGEVVVELIFREGKPIKP